MNTDESLDAVLRCAREEQSVIDIVLSTGDISMHGDQPSYRRYREKVSPLASKHAYLPGNHDKVDLMQAELAEQGGWQDHEDRHHALPVHRQEPLRGPQPIDTDRRKFLAARR